MPGGHLLFSRFNYCGSCAGLMSERVLVKLTQLSRGKSFLAGEYRRSSRATTEASSFFHSVESQSKPTLFQFPGTGRITSCRESTYQEELASESVSSIKGVIRDQTSTRKPVNINFGSSFLMPAYELDEDFEAETCISPQSSTKQAVPGNDSQKVSVRIEPLRAGVLDKEVLRKRRTQPFSDKCWMQSLGVGLYRDKLRNRRSLSHLASHNFEEQRRGSCSGDASEKQSAGSEEPQMGERKVIVGDGKTEQSQDEVSSNVANSDAFEDIGVVATDSDDEIEEPSEWDARNIGTPSLAIEESLEALMASLKELETSADPGDVRIGATCLRLAQLCDSLDEDAEKILMYGQRAFKILGSAEVSPETSMCLQVIGSAYFKMDESEKAVAQLEKAALLIEKLEATMKERQIGTFKYALQVLLVHAKMALGRHDEALVNYHESISINERLLEPGNPDLARTYQQVAEACLEADDPEEAMCLCKKALPIYTNYYGPKSVEVAVIRRLMALIYRHDEEYEKVLCEHEIVRPILESAGKAKEVVSLDLASGEALIFLERYRKAIPTLKKVVDQTKENSRFHGHALVLLAKAFAGLKEDKNAAKYCKKALSALRDKKLSLEAGASLVDLASVYQQLNEQEQSMAALKRALEIFEEFPDEQEAAADVEGQIGLLFLFMGKVDEGLPYLSKAAMKLEDLRGPESEELLAVYNHIAIANLELGNLDDALDKFEAAKDIATKRIGPDDPDTVAIYHNLVNTYSAMGSFRDELGITQGLGELDIMQGVGISDLY